MSQTTKHAHEWQTAESATPTAHDAAFARYDGEKTAYRYEVCDCGTVRIDESGNGANGIHTLGQVEEWLSEGAMPLTVECHMACGAAGCDHLFECPYCGANPNAREQHDEGCTAIRDAVAKMARRMERLAKEARR